MKKTGTAIVGVIFTVLAILIASSLFRKFFMVKKLASVTIIGGADGPTSVFLAGKIGDTGSDMSLVAVIVGVIIVLAVAGAIFKLIKK